MLSFPSLTRKILLSGLMLATLAACDRQSGADKQPPAAIQSTAAETPAGEVDRSHKGSRLPDLSFQDASGKTIRTTGLTGKPLLINLWATWCGPCVAELPELDKLAAQGKVQVLTLSQDSAGAKDKVAPFLKDKGMTHLGAWLDPEAQAAMQWQASTLPASIYYDAQGREVWRVNGSKAWTSPEGAALMAEAGG